MLRSPQRCEEFIQGGAGELVHRGSSPSCEGNTMVPGRASPYLRLIGLGVITVQVNAADGHAEFADQRRARALPMRTVTQQHVNCGLCGMFSFWRRITSFKCIRMTT